MDIGLKHLFYAFAAVWLILFGFLLNLAGRQRRLSDEVQALKDSLKRKNSG